MNYTSSEQSNKLVELGLDPKTADMYWSIVDGETFICIENHSCDCKTIPCWSLNALLLVMPDIVLYNGGKECYPCLERNVLGDFICYYEDDLSMKSFIGHSAVEAAFRMVCWLLDNGYIEKIKK